MHVTSISAYAPSPGLLVEWEPTPSSHPGDPATAPPSFNQQFHLATAAQDPTHPPTWLATAFDVPGPVNYPAMRATLETWLARHPVLLSSFHAPEGHPVGSAPFTRMQHDVTPIRRRGVGTSFGDQYKLRDHLQERLTELCHPLTYPAFYFGAIDRPSHSTVIAGFDHVHADGLSLTIAAQELSAIYAAIRENGEPPTFADVGDFEEYCIAEAATADVSSTDPLVGRWLEFFARCDNAVPSFPLPLGVEPGQFSPQANSEHTLLDGAAADRFEAWCCRRGSGIYAGVLAAMTTAISELGGGDHLNLLYPLHTRREQRWSAAMGWFITNAPLTVTVERDFAATVRQTHVHFKESLALATIPVGTVLTALGGTFHRPRSDVFMVSYIDYRKLASADALTKLNAHHISNSTVADDAQLWISRTPGALSLRARFPGNPLAAATMARFVATTMRILAETDHAALSAVS